MYFPNILSLLSVCILTHYANSEENLHIDDSKFGSLELPNSPKKFTVAQQVTYFRDIKSISNVIQNVQKRMEDEYTMQASLTTNSKHSNKELEFKSLVSSFLQAEFFSSENNSLPLFPELTFNCTADYCGHDDTERVNCTNSVLLNQTDTSVEIVYSQSSLDDILKFDPNIIDWNTSALCTLVLFYDSSCELSILAAPHFNIFPRIFPQIKMVAFNIANMIQKTKENLRELPTLALYHNGELFADYQDIEYTIQTFTEFVMYYTGLYPNEMVEITVSDFVKPIFGFRNLDTNYFLWLAWIVIIFWVLYYANQYKILNKMFDFTIKIWYGIENHEHNY